MENKKSLRVNCALCDVRNITEELLNTYSEVRVNCATVVTSPAAQALLGQFNVRFNCSNTLTLEEGVRFSTINGPMTISAGQAIPEEKLVVSVNGSLTLEPGCEEQLKSYAFMSVNGPVRCPASMVNLLGSFSINGPIQTYPDGAVLLNNTTILDRFFHLRAKQDTLYYAAGRIVALSPDIHFEKLADKNVRFFTKTLLVTESLAETAVPLFDDKTDIVVLPDGCAYVDDDAELDEALIKRYGGKLYVNGDMTIGPEAAGLLDQVSCLRINGDLLVCASLKDQVLEMDIEYKDLHVVGGTLISGRSLLNLTTAMLSDAADGLSVTACATVIIAEDVTPELLREKLVSIAACAAVVCANEEQAAIIQTRGTALAAVSLSSDDEPEEAPEDENVVRVNAASYTF